LLLATAGCETLDGLLAGMSKSAGPDFVPIEDRPVQDPIDGNTFTLASDEQTVIGEPQIVLAGTEDTFSDLARTYGLGCRARAHRCSCQRNTCCRMRRSEA